MLNALNNPGSWALLSLCFDFFENAVPGKPYMSSEEPMFTLLNETQIYATSFSPSCPGF